MQPYTTTISHGFFESGDLVGNSSNRPDPRKIVVISIKIMASINIHCLPGDDGTYIEMACQCLSTDIELIKDKIDAVISVD